MEFNKKILLSSNTTIWYLRFYHKSSFYLFCHTLCVTILCSFIKMIESFLFYLLCLSNSFIIVEWYFIASIKNLNMIFVPYSGTIFVFVIFITFKNILFILIFVTFLQKPKKGKWIFLDLYITLVTYLDSKYPTWQPIICQLKVFCKQIFFLIVSLFLAHKSSILDKWEKAIIAYLSTWNSWLK